MIVEINGKPKYGQRKLMADMMILIIVSCGILVKDLLT